MQGNKRQRTGDINIDNNECIRISMEALNNRIYYLQNESIISYKKLLLSRLLIFRTTNEETKKQAIYNSIVANYISSINDYRLAKSIRIYTDCQIYLKYHQLTENSKIAILSIAKKARESEVHAFVRQKMSQTYYQIFRIIKNLNLK